MENKALFRTAFQGFKKEDVVAYIDQLSRDTNRMLAEKEAEIKELRAQLTGADDKCIAAEKKCEEMSAQLAGKGSEICRLNDKVRQLEEELSAAHAKTEMPEGAVTVEVFEALEKEYNGAVAEKKALAKQLEVYREFDGVQRDLGTIIIKAEKNAAEIIAQAKKKSDDMISEALRTAQEITDKKIKICAEIAETFDSSKSNMDKAHRTLCENLDTIKSAVDTFYNSLESGRRVVHENVDAVTDIKCEFINENNN